MNSINKTNFTSMNGLSDIYSDDIVSNNLTTDSVITNTLVLGGNDLTSTLSSIETYETDTNTTLSNLQSQLNNITSTSSSGGGYFTVVCERLGHAANNTFGFGAGLYNNNEIVLPACTLKMSRCTSSLNMTSGTSYYVFYKNGVGTAVSTGIFTPNNSNTVSHNLTFASGDTFKIVTLNTGGYSSNTTVQLRINLIFECVGIKGSDGISPSITIGTVSTLPSSSDATITNTGTSTNQIINYGIPRGIQGIQGVTPTFSIGNVSNLASSDIPFVNFDTLSTATNKIFNFGLVQGVTPTFSVGSVVNLPNGSSPYVNIDSSSTLTNKILNFGIVRGYDGTNGTNGTNGIDAGDIGNAVGTSAAFLILQGQVTVLQGQMTTVQGQILAIDGTLGSHTTEIATLQNEVGTLDQTLSGIETKLYNVVKTPDALQVKSKFQIINNVGGLVGTIVLATFDPIGNTITLGTTSTTNNMVGNTINMGSLSTANVNLRATSINIGNENNSTATTNILGTTINTGSSSTTTTNIKGNTINVGGENLGGGVINIEAPNIYMGTAGYFNNVYIGSTFSNVRIESMDNTAINVGNFISQF